MILSSRNHGKPYIVALGVAMTFLAGIVLYAAFRTGILDIRSKASGIRCITLQEGSTCPPGYAFSHAGIRGQSEVSTGISPAGTGDITCCQASLSTGTQSLMGCIPRPECVDGIVDPDTGETVYCDAQPGTVFCTATPTQEQTVPCQRCSNNFGCKMATWKNAGADCEPVNPVEPVDYRLDCNCPAVSEAVLANDPEHTGNDACSICAAMTPTPSDGITIQGEIQLIQQSGGERGLFHETETNGETVWEQDTDVEQLETPDESGITPLDAPDSLNERARAALCTFFRICGETTPETLP